MIPQPTFKVSVTEFDSAIQRYAKAAGITFLDAVKHEAMLLGRELMQRTPPFSGKTIIKMLSGRQNAVLSDIGVTELNARQVGLRRVEKDVRKVIYGVRNDATADAGKSEISAHIKKKLKGTGQRLNGMPVQMCQGKVAVRIFATKTGEVYGIDYANWLPKATDGDLAKAHTAARGKRGRVSLAGERTVNVGRWRWIHAIITKEATAKRYVRRKQYMVGQAKGGWGMGFITAGGKLGLGGWIGRHLSAGAESHNWSTTKPWISFINNSRWASSGDPDRVIQASLLGRAKALEGAIKRKLEDKWKDMRIGVLPRARSAVNFAKAQGVVR